MKRKIITPPSSSLQGGRLERTLAAREQKRAAGHWRGQALGIALLVFLCISGGICLVIYRIEQNTLWFSITFNSNDGQADLTSLE